MFIVIIKCSNIKLGEEDLTCLKLFEKKKTSWTHTCHLNGLSAIHLLLVHQRLIYFLSFLVNVRCNHRSNLLIYKVHWSNTFSFPFNYCYLHSNRIDCACNSLVLLLACNFNTTILSIKVTFTNSLDFLWVEWHSKNLVSFSLHVRHTIHLMCHRIH